MNFKSLILVEPKKIEILKNWVNPSQKILNAKLLYRLTRDGDQFFKFHQLCDNKGPTITLFETINNLKVGFYSPLDFDSNYGTFKKDMNTFIFNLDTEVKYTKKTENGSIYCKNNIGPFLAYFGVFSLNNNINMKNFFYNPNSTKENFNLGDCIISNNHENVIFNLKEIEIWKIS